MGHRAQPEGPQAGASIPSWEVWPWPAGRRGARSRPGGRVGREEEKLLGFPEESLFHLLTDIHSITKPLRKL